MDLPREIDFSKTRAPAIAAHFRLGARERIAHFVKMANSQGIALKMPTVSFDLRGKVSGQAYPKNNHIRLNSVMLSENFDKYMASTIGHEVAHLAQRLKYGKSVDAHGPEWQAVMVSFGLEPKRCHNYNTTNSAVSKSYAFICGCEKTHMISSRRLKRALRGGYACLTCEKKLKASPDIELPTAYTAPSIVARPKSTLKHPPTTAIRRSPSVTPRASAPTPVASMAPTAAMLKYARDLALRTRQPLPAAVLSSRVLCAEFIERAKQTPAEIAPTEKQLAFAKKLASAKGIRVPLVAISSRQAMSRWLDAMIAN